MIKETAKTNTRMLITPRIAQSSYRHLLKELQAYPRFQQIRGPGIAPTTSSIFNLISNLLPNTTIAPPIAPIIIVTPGVGAEVQQYCY